MDKSTKILLIAIAVLAIGTGIFFGIRAIKKRMDSKSFNSQDTIDNPKTPAEIEKNKKAQANIFANQLRTAFNVSGNDWMIDWDTTDTTSVLSIGTQIKAKGIPFSYLAKAYDTAYKDDLAKRLQSELSSSELTTFYKNSGLQGLQGFAGLGAMREADIIG